MAIIIHIVFNAQNYFTLFRNEIIPSSIAFFGTRLTISLIRKDAFEVWACAKNACSLE